MLHHPKNGSSGNRFTLNFIILINIIIFIIYIYKKQNYILIKRKTSGYFLVASV